MNKHNIIIAWPTKRGLMTDMIVLCYANTLKHNGKTNEARQILLQSLKSNPNGSYKRYFEMGELEEGER